MRFRGLGRDHGRTTPAYSQNFPVHYDDPYAIHVTGDDVTVEIAFAGETEDGVPAAWEAVDVFTLEDGRVRRLTTWYDMDRVVSFRGRRARRSGGCARSSGTRPRRARSTAGASRSSGSKRTPSPRARAAAA